jgi:hypothetical protein
MAAIGKHGLEHLTEHGFLVDGSALLLPFCGVGLGEFRVDVVLIVEPAGLRCSSICGLGLRVSRGEFYGGCGSNCPRSLVCGKFAGTLLITDAEG